MIIKRTFQAPRRRWSAREAGSVPPAARQEEGAGRKAPGVCTASRQPSATVISPQGDSAPLPTEAVMAG